MGITGILQVIGEAKTNNSHWAEQALAEICLLTGRDYRFVPDRENNRYEVRLWT